jgi:MFS family permease
VAASAQGAERLLTAPFVLVIALGFAGFIAIASLLPTLPRYADGPLDAGPVGIGLAVGASSITALFGQPVAGRLADLRGRRLLLLSGTALTAASIACYVVVDSLPLLVALRLLTGGGEALWFVGAATTISDLAPPARRGEAVSYFTLALYSGLAVGPLLGDLVLAEASFDAVWLLASASAGVAFAVALAVPETRPAGVSAAAKIVHRGALAPGFVLLAALFAFGGFNAFIALWALEVGVERTGLVFATFALVVVAVRSLGARLPDRLGPRRAGLLALLGVASGMAIVAAWPTEGGVFAGTLVFSFGQALAFPAMMTYAVQRAPESERGAAVGTISAFVDVAIVSGAVALGFVVDAAGYRAAFLTAAAVAVSGLLLLARLRGEAP